MPYGASGIVHLICGNKKRFGAKDIALYLIVHFAVRLRSIIINRLKIV